MKLIKWLGIITVISTVNITLSLTVYFELIFLLYKHAVDITDCVIVTLHIMKHRKQYGNKTVIGKVNITLSLTVDFELN